MVTTLFTADTKPFICKQLNNLPPIVSDWQLSCEQPRCGYYCDGKCWNGAMRPGNGIAHKACANLCLIGGLPAVLVTTTPVAGSTFLLLADADGGPMPESLRPMVGLRISLDGSVERRGDLLVMRATPASARRL